MTATLPDDGCRLFGPIAPPPKGNEPPSRPVDPDPTGGFYQPVIASLEGVYSLGSVRLDCGIQRAAREQLLSYNAQYRKNENPRVAALELADDGTAVEPGSTPTLSVAPGAAVSLTASWDACPTEPVCGDGICGAYEDRANCEVDCAVDAPKGCTGAEPYVWYDLETFTVEPRHEGIRVAWYALGGQLRRRADGTRRGRPRAHGVERLAHSRALGSGDAVARDPRLARRRVLGDLSSGGERMTASSDDDDHCCG